MRILAISGSLQSSSANLALLRAVAAWAPVGVEVDLCDGLRQLPHFNPELEAHGPCPSVQQWRQALSYHDALLIASPEYGFSLPGVLKNGIDWVIGTGELERKIIAITASVNHPDRGRRGLQALCNTLSAVSAQIVGGNPIVRGATFETEGKALLDALVAAVRGNTATE